MAAVDFQSTDPWPKLTRVAQRRLKKQDEIWQRGAIRRRYATRGHSRAPNRGPRSTASFTASLRDARAALAHRVAVPDGSRGLPVHGPMAHAQPRRVATPENCEAIRRRYATRGHSRAPNRGPRSTATFTASLRDMSFSLGPGFAKTHAFDRLPPMKYSSRCFHTTSRTRWLRLLLTLCSAIAAGRMSGAAPAEALAGRSDLTSSNEDSGQWLGQWTLKTADTTLGRPAILPASQAEQSEPRDHAGPAGRDLPRFREQVISK